MGMRPKVRKSAAVISDSHWVPCSMESNCLSVMNHISQPIEMVTILMMTARNAITRVRSWVSGVISATMLQYGTE